MPVLGGWFFCARGCLHEGTQYVPLIFYDSKELLRLGNHPGNFAGRTGQRTTMRREHGGTRKHGNDDESSLTQGIGARIKAAAAAIGS
ncbi:MAG: hypothetical protein WD138_00825, partial [Halofilum sp. (in: g-proteobacteria)]